MNEPLTGRIGIAQEDHYFQQMPDLEKLGRLAMAKYSNDRNRYLDQWVREHLIEMGMDKDATDEQMLEEAVANGVRVKKLKFPGDDCEQLAIYRHGKLIAHIPIVDRERLS